MTLAPRFLVDFLARHRAKRLRQRLARQGDGGVEQAAAFRALLARLERTAFGRQHGIQAKMPLAEFREKVPLRTPAEFRTWTERMAGGETDVLWPGRCRLFLYTAGTVDGTPKLLPATADLLLHFRRSLRDALLLHVLRAGQPGIFGGLQLHAGGSTALTEANGAYAGYLDAMAGLALSSWAEKNLYAPAPALARLPESEQKMSALAAAYAGRDVRLVGGSPVSLLGLAAAVRAARPDGTGSLKSVWRHLECALHTGAPADLHLGELKAGLGSGVGLQEIYAAAEGFLAAQDGEPGEGLRVLSDSGVFLEFLPVHDLDQHPLSVLGAHCVSLAEVQTGLDYAVVVTNPAGLCRCLIGDSVRFLSTAPPRLRVTGRTPLRLNSFGEQVSERDLLETLLGICSASDWKIVDFHVAPYFTRMVPRAQGCHEWWVELRPGTIRTPTGPLLAGELDAALCRRNRDYHARRSSGALGPPVVRLVMPGTFAQWARLHSTPGGAARLPRNRNDRRIADQLAGIARFHSGTQPPFPATL